MSKNFFRRIIESASIDKFFNTSNDSEDKSHDFERAKDVLFSSKNSTQLISAVKYINNFNKKHKIGEKSPEFIYFDKMINIMRTKLRSRNVKIDDDLSDGKLDDVDSVNENSDWDWVKSIGTLPPEIVNFQHLPKGNYKIWFGDMSQERQLLILDYLVDVIELSDGLTTTPQLETIRQMVRNGEFYTRALFIIQTSMDSENKGFIFTVSGWYPEDKESKKDSLNRNLRYFNNSSHTDLGKTTLKESNDFDWIRDVEPTNLDFDFDGKECWVDVSKIDREGRRKIVNYIKKTLPNYEEFESDLFGHISRGDYKGIIIHCGSDLNDFEPEENLLCSSNSSYEDDYEIDNPYADISKSIYIDGQDILDYISVVDEEEELEESLEWSDKDTPFDEKDKSFESDPSWKNDEDWSLNPERSYWKQGDAGGSGGGDMNESDDFDWVKDIRPNWGTYYEVILDDVQKLPKNLEDVTSEMLLPIWMKIETINSEIFTRKNLDGDTNERVFESMHRIEQLFTGIMSLVDGETASLVSSRMEPQEYYNSRKLTIISYIQGMVQQLELLGESNDLDWIKDVKIDPLMASPDVFFRDDDEMYYTLGELGHDITNMEEFTMCELAINYGYRWSEEHEGWYHRDEVADFTKGNYPKGVRRGLDESDELQWIKDVPDTIPPIERRNKISIKDFLVDIMKGDVNLLHHFISEDTIGPTTEYMRTGNGGEGFTPEDWDDFGYDVWSNDGHWVDNHEWREDPQIWQYEIRESMELTNGIWEMVEWDTLDYDLEQGSHMDRMVFKRKSDGAYFALNFSGSHYDGIDSWNEEIYQVFPKQITKFIYESDLIKKIIKEEVEDIDIAYEDKNLVVIHPKTREASCRYGSDTQWCTAAEGGESFNQYDSSGNLYYYLWKFKMPPQLQNFQKIARLINYGKEYGETGEFFLFNDETMTPHDILFNVLQGKEKGGSFTYPTKLKPLYESWERALIAVDTHYAKSGLHKTPSEYQDDDGDFGYDEDYGYDDGYY